MDISLLIEKRKMPLHHELTTLMEVMAYIVKITRVAI